MTTLWALRSVDSGAAPLAGSVVLALGLYLATQFRRGGAA
jgi:hypothetical protein